MMSWINYLIIAILLIIGELIYFKIARRFNIVDKPNQRSSHTRTTLRGGGVIFVLAMILFSCFNSFEYSWFIGGLLIVSTIAFIDDIKSISNLIRLVLHFIAILLLFQQIDISLFFPWQHTIISLIIFVGIINAYNFMDGINGMTGGYSIVVLLPLLYINEVEKQFVDSSFLYVAIISLIIFNFFNFRAKAKCFAGDVGAVSMAFIVLFVLSSLITTTGRLYYIGFLAVYGVDSVLTICHRITLEENIFKAHKMHLYQILANELKMPQIVVSLIYMGIQLVISAGFIFLDINMWVYLGAVITVLVVTYIIFIKKFFYLHLK